jgi:hypothetical protein
MTLRLFALAAVLALATGCPGRMNVIQVTEHMVIGQSDMIAGGYYDGYSGTSFSPGIPSNKKVRLLGLKASSSSGEFSWVDSVTGAADNAMTEVVVDKSSFAGASGTTELDVVDTGDLRGLMPDSNSFKLYWALNYAPSFTQAYPDGVTVTLTYTIEIE